MRLARKKRVRVHLIEDGLPSLEGLLVARRRGEYLLALPTLIVHPDAAPAELAAARLLAVPRERVAFYEVLR